MRPKRSQPTKLRPGQLVDCELCDYEYGIGQRRTASSLNAEVGAICVNLRRVGRVDEDDLVVVTRAERDVGHREGLF